MWLVSVGMFLKLMSKPSGTASAVILKSAFFLAQLKTNKVKQKIKEIILKDFILKDFRALN